MLLHIASHLETDDLVKATHISYHWRTVLLAHSSLWSTLNLTTPKQASVFLTRSKSAAIHVFFPKFGSKRLLSLFKLLGKSAERIATLKIHNTMHQRELLLRAMPTLETLDFSIRPDCRRPNEAANWTFPVMKTLVLDSLNFLPLSAPRLTRFTFIPSFVTRQSRAIDGLLDFLSGCLLLEDLVLFRPDNFYVERHRDPVHLPCLRLCAHDISTASYIQLYNLLSYPPSCTVTLTYNHGRDETLDAAVFPPFHEPTFHIDARRVKLKTRSSGREDCIEGTVEVIDRTRRRFRSTREVVLGGKTLEDVLKHTINPLYPDFIKSLDAKLIEVLCVEELASPLLHPRGDDCVGEVLDHLENIRTLILSGSAVEPYLRALVAEGTRNTGKWRCTKLDALVIHGPHTEYRQYDVFSELRQIARERRLAGLPLRYVSVFLGNDWNPEQPRLPPEELREWVGTFELVVGGDELLDWSVDNYFLEGLGRVWRDCYVE